MAFLIITVLSDMVQIQKWVSGFKESGIMTINSSVSGEKDFLTSDKLLGYNTTLIQE